MSSGIKPRSETPARLEETTLVVSDEEKPVDRPTQAFFAFLTFRTSSWGVAANQVSSDYFSCSSTWVR